MLFKDMAAISTKLRQGEDGVMFHWCPGCGHAHGIWIEGLSKSKGPKWSFDNNVEAPTFSPSIRISSTKPLIPGDEDSPMVEYTKCHYFIQGGIIKYLIDSIHQLAGKELPLPDFHL